MGKGWLQEGLGQKWILLTLPFSSPGSKWEEAQKEGSGLFSARLAFSFHPSEVARSTGQKTAWRLGNRRGRSMGKALPVQAKFLGPTKKSQRTGLNSFSLPPPALSDRHGGNTLGSPWAHKAGLSQGFLTLSCPPGEGSSRSMSLSSRN